jgi:integrase
VATVEHHAALPYADLPGFMVELRQHKDDAARALEFLILTAARTSEVVGAEWHEIDFKARLWTVPGSRMKAGREHKVSLSDAALAILEACRSARPFPIVRDAMLVLLQQMGRSDLTVHGFRATFTNWCAETTNTPVEVRRMALAHTVGDAVEQAYRRSDLFEKRRELMEAWARFAGAP